MRLSVQVVSCYVPADCSTGGTERVEQQQAVVLSERRSSSRCVRSCSAAAIRSVKCGASISTLRIAACRRRRASAYSAGEPRSVRGGSRSRT